MLLDNFLVFYIINEVTSDTQVLFNSVLEQFAITKYELTLGFYDITKKETIDTVFRKQGFFFIIFTTIYNYTKWFVVSMFIPTWYNTKTFVYGRFVFIGVKVFLNIFLKKKLFIFLRTNSQFIKLRIKSNLQATIKSNFGHSYPFLSRLLEFYPFISAIFLLIIMSNFNGLLFYGFTNTAFLLQNFVYSAETVIGLTLLE